MLLICESALTSKLPSTGTLCCWVVRFTLWPQHTHTRCPPAIWVTCPTLQTWFNNNPVLNLALHKDEESSSAMFLHFYQISGSPWEVGLQGSHTHWLSWCLQLRQRSRDTFLKNTPSSLPPNLAVLLLMAEVSLMSPVCQPKPHSSAGAREAGSLFVEMLYFGEYF